MAKAKSARGAKKAAGSAARKGAAKGAARKSAARRPAAKKTAARKSAAKGSAKKSGMMRRAAKPAARRGAAKSSAGGARRANAAFMAPVTPSPALAAVVGDRPVPRTEITKRLWDYIKRNGLQDQKNRRMINADDSLKPIFGGKSQVSMFDMTKLVGKHLS